jgi:glycosyltransferase involved in cell wall biosynthesis
MNPKLSIIIPCYNCTATLSAAVDSVYAQNFTVPFEIVMVDDKSKDDTIGLMQTLAAKHPEIKLYYHSHNKGGGAARNTGISQSSGELIFCLDSDNLLYPNTMQNMVDFIEAEQCDGVVIHERRYFKEQDQSHFTAHFNPTGDTLITFENLFDETSAILDNFLFTRSAYDRTVGYPEEHGFDTQCFEIRFLSAGNTAKVCPNSIFLHRQAILTKGYFHRVYEEGFFSINFYLIFEEIIHLFSSDSIKEIIGFDIFTRNKLGTDNIKAHFADKYKRIGRNIFRDNYRTYLVQNGAELFNSKLDHTLTPEETFVRAVHLFHNQDYKTALTLFKGLIAVYPHSKVIPYNVARCEVVLAGTPYAQIERLAIKESGYIPTPRTMELNANPLIVLFVTLKQCAKRAFGRPN